MVVVVVIAVVVVVGPPTVTLAVPSALSLAVSVAFTSSLHPSAGTPLLGAVYNPVALIELPEHAVPPVPPAAEISQV
jgi:hypothetical protein